MNKEKILGFDVCSNKQQDLLIQLFDDYNHNIQNMVVNINPEIIISNYKNKDLVKKLNEQKYQIPDGIGVVYASKINKGNITQRIAGIDFMEMIIKKSLELNSRIFLYGAKPEVIRLAKKELEKKYPGINIVGFLDGYQSTEEAVKIIEKVNPDILFVGTGSPKQEKFILENKDKFRDTKILMPVGGSFDVISKSLKRAPKLIIKLNLEWLYRLIKQPSRFFRQLKLIKFIFYVLIKK
mgnify:CR=1 FL=1